jgi:prevent-host-death family protein
VIVLPKLGVRELKNRASEVVRRVREEGTEYVITYQGRPVAVILPLAEEDLEDYVLAHHPHLVELRERARASIQRGEFVTSGELRSLLEE